MKQQHKQICKNLKIFIRGFTQFVFKNGKFQKINQLIKEKKQIELQMFQQRQRGQQQLLQSEVQINGYLVTHASKKTTFCMTNNPDCLDQSQIIIKNYLCYLQDGKLKKTTVVSSSSQEISIQDFYEIKTKENTQTFMAQQYNVTSNAKNEQFVTPFLNQKKGQRTCFFKRKDMAQKIETDYAKRDTKNIVKNFTKAFFKYLEQTQLKQQHEIGKGLVQSTGFNNTLIQAIITNDAIRSKFDYFLRKEALHWLQHSKIKNKNSHQQAIKIYIQNIERYDSQHQRKK